MPEWIEPLLGPLGTLVLLILISHRGFSYFTAMLEKQEIKYDKQAERFDELHTSTLTHIHAQTEVIRKLSEQITDCTRGK